MEAKKIYLDMDGVLADFDRGIRELCHMEPQPMNGKRDAKADDHFTANCNEKRWSDNNR